MARKQAQAFPLVSMLALACPLTKMGSVIFAEIYRDEKDAGRTVCTRCGYFDNGNCEPYRKLAEASPTEDDLKKAINLGMALFVLNCERVTQQPGGVITAALFNLFTNPLRPDGEAILAGMKRDFPGQGGDDYDFVALCNKVVETIKAMDP